MKSNSKRCRSAAIVVAAVMTFMFGSAAPSVAADNIEPPSLTYIKMLSPTVMYATQDVLWVGVAVGSGHGDLFYDDSLGATHNVCFDECGMGFADTAVDDLKGWPQGPVSLTHIEVRSPSGGRVVYWRDGSVEKFPSDMKDPAPVAIDWASLDFRLDPLREYSTSPKLRVEGPPSVGFTLNVELAALDPKPTRVEYEWMHLDSPEARIGSGRTHGVTAADIGHSIIARVRAYTRGYVTYESISAPTNVVATPVPVTPAPVVITDRDGTANDTYTIPTTVGIEYHVGGAGSRKVVAAGTYSYSTADTFFGSAWAKPGYILAPDAVSAWSTTFKTTPYLVAPAAVTFMDKDGTNEDTYSIPATTGIDYLIGGEVVAAGKYPATGTITATARPKTDYALATGAPAFWSTTFKATPYLVSPVAVTFTDKVGTKDDTYTVPATTGVEYLVDGAVVAAGTYPGTWVVIVSALAKKDYVLAPGAPALWVAAFKGSLSGAVPTITGTAKVGSTLTAGPGAWGPDLVNLTYQWKAGGDVILGATNSTYKPTSAYVGKSLTVTVTGSKAGFANMAKTSGTTARVVKGSLAGSTPQITGTAKVGSTLTANPGTWLPATVSPRYQWYRSGVAIIGATGLAHKLTSADVSKTLTFRVTAYKIGYTTAVKTSAATAAVVKGSLVGPTPQITGIAKVGSTLTANTGIWSPATISPRYQWYRSGVAIIGATALTYKPTSADVGKTLTFRVTAYKIGYTTAVKTSAATVTQTSSRAPVPETSPSREGTGGTFMPAGTSGGNVEPQASVQAPLTGIEVDSAPGAGTAYPAVEPLVEAASPAAAPVSPDAGPPVAAAPTAMASSSSSEEPSEPAIASARETSTAGSFSPLPIVLTFGGTMLACALVWFCRPVRAALVRRRGTLVGR